MHDTPTPLRLAHVGGPTDATRAYPCEGAVMMCEPELERRLVATTCLWSDAATLSGEGIITAPPKPTRQPILTSMASRSPSPRRLQAITAKTIARPGNADTHHADKRTSRPSNTMLPQLGVGG